jgi:hypothetical protein
MYIIHAPHETGCMVTTKCNAAVAVAAAGATWGSTQIAKPLLGRDECQGACIPVYYPTRAFLGAGRSCNKATCAEQAYLGEAHVTVNGAALDAFASVCVTKSVIADSRAVPGACLGSFIPIVVAVAIPAGAPRAG